MQRPFLSQSPYRVGSGPLGPPFSLVSGFTSSGNPVKEEIKYYSILCHINCIDLKYIELVILSCVTCVYPFDRYPLTFYV